MKDFSVSIALVDYIPVLCFGAAIILLQSDLHQKMSKIAFALFATGTLNVTIAGFLKATYKLLYALGVCDFEALNAMFFPTQSFGFLLAGVGLILFWVQKREEKLLAVAPPLFTGTFVFVGLMVAGLGMIDVVLCLIAAKLKKKGVIALFVLSFVCSLGMGYLSSQDFAKASMNWIAEGVNVVGQGTLLAGVWILHKNGLKDIR